MLIIASARNINLGQLGATSLLLKFKYAPINPSDINQIQGVYPIKPDVPNAFAGNEGLAEVVQVGSGLGQKWVEGDLVIPTKPCFGTWRNYAVATPEDLVKLPKETPHLEAATLSVNLCSAYRMIKDFSGCKGRIIQNAANSGVGRYVIQLAKLWGYETVNIIRKRDDVSKLVQELQDIGASEIIFQEDLVSSRASLKEKFPGGFDLALNCVGGNVAVEMLRHLKDGGTMVTYGAMSREPISVPASLLIFKDIALRGFWMGKWKQDHSSSKEYSEMMKQLLDYIKTGQIKSPPVHVIDLDFSHDNKILENTLKDALTLASKPYLDKKVVLKMT